MEGWIVVQEYMDDIFYAENDYMALGIVADKDKVVIGAHGPGEIGKGDAAFIHLTREEAIAAAKAILKHFDQDWNAYEENISERYRAPTEEEMAKFLAENPNYKPIPKEAYDPDAPLTSELAQNFGEE